MPLPVRFQWTSYRLFMMYATKIPVCRGPEQLLNEAAQSGESRRSGMSEEARVRLQGYMAEGLGDHILYLRLYEVMCC